MHRLPRVWRSIVQIDGSFRHNSAGHLTMPTGSKMFGEMKRLGEYICWVDEHRTSKCCSTCGADTVDAVLAKKVAIKRTSQFVGRTKRACDRKHTARRAAKRQHLLEHPLPAAGDGDFVPWKRNHRRAHPAIRMSSLCRWPKATTALVPALAGFIFPPLDRNRQMVHEDDGADELEPDLDPDPPPSAAADAAAVASSPLAILSSTTSSPVGRLLPTGSCVNQWGLRACVSPQCRNRLWCRDVNACANMARRVAWWLVHGVVGPSHLCSRAADRAVARRIESLFLQKLGQA
jgi:hypothetical protein